MPCVAAGDHVHSMIRMQMCFPDAQPHCPLRRKIKSARRLIVLFADLPTYICESIRIAIIREIDTFSFEDISHCTFYHIWNKDMIIKRA